MSSSLDKLKALTSRLEDKLEEKEKTSEVSPSEKPKPKISEKKPSPKPRKIVEINCDNVRNDNIKRVEELYVKLKIKYIQIIAITYEPDKNGKKKAKNISLGYFGKAETLENILKNEIIEFVLRWRYEKAFQNVEHYKDLIERVETPSETLF